MALVGTGYNAEEIQKLDVAIDNTCASIWDIWSKTWGSIEEGIAEFLFTPKGKNETVPAMYKKMQASASQMSKDFEYFVDKINEVQKAWVNAVGYSISKSKKGTKKAKSKLSGGAVSLIDGTFPTGNIELKGIVADRDANGSQGVNEAIGNDFLNKLENYKTSLTNEINGYKTSLIADSAFLGGGQSDALEELFARMLNNFSEYFNTTRDYIHTQISNTLSEYGSLATANAGKFSSVNFPLSK